MSLLSRFILGTALLLVSVLPADAVQPRGSAGWTTDGWTNYTGILYAGPGTEYSSTGNVAAGIRIRVDRCSKLWCQIHVGHLAGWLPLYNVSFGQRPSGWLSGPRFPHWVSGGTLCFFSGSNYRGAETCIAPGHVYKDLKLVGLDNAFGSVKIDGAGSALVCRDRDFRSYCKVIDVDTPHLEGLLDHAITSIRVY